MNNYRIKAGIIPAFFVLFLFSLPLRGQAVKGIWVVRHSITNSYKVHHIVNFAEKNNYTDLFVQVRGRGDALYNSSFVSRSVLLKDETYDPLKDIITLAHAKGIRVHAWINVYLTWSARSLPKDPNHIINRHPEWIEVNGRGQSDLEFVPQNGKNGREGIYLSPLNKEANAYMLKVIEEIVHNYDIDGLHLDYIRFQDRDYGFNRAGRKDFLMKYNVDPITLGNGNGSYWYRLNAEQKEKYWKLWNDFRRETLTRFITRINQRVKTISPAVQLSAAVKPNPDVARNRFYQDWPSWLQQGAVDFVVVMNYAKAGRDFQNNMYLIERENLNKENIYMGVATYNQKSSAAVDKILRSRKSGFHDLVIFSYNTYEKNPAYFYDIHRILNK